MPIICIIRNWSQRCIKWCRACNIWNQTEGFLIKETSKQRKDKRISKITSSYLESNTHATPQNFYFWLPILGPQIINQNLKAISKKRIIWIRTSGLIVMNQISKLTLSKPMQIQPQFFHHHFSHSGIDLSQDAGRLKGKEMGWIRSREMKSSGFYKSLQKNRRVKSDWISNNSLLDGD